MAIRLGVGLVAVCAALVIAATAALRSPVAPEVALHPSSTPLPQHDADLAIRAEADGTIRLLTEPVLSGDREAVDELRVPPTGPVVTSTLLPASRSREFLDGALLPDDTALLGFAASARSISVATNSRGVLGSSTVIATGAKEYDGPYVHVSASGAAAVSYDERQARPRHRSRWVARYAFRGVGATAFNAPVTADGQVSYSDEGDGALFQAEPVPTVRRISRAGNMGPAVVLDSRPLGSSDGHATVASDGTVLATWMARPRGHTPMDLRWSALLPGETVATPPLRLGIGGESSTEVENFAIVAAGDLAFVVAGLDAQHAKERPQLRIFEGTVRGPLRLGHRYFTSAPSGATVVAHPDGAADLVWTSWNPARRQARLLDASRSADGVWDPQPTVLAAQSAEIDIDEVAPIPTGGAAVVFTTGPTSTGDWQSVLVRTQG